MRTLQTECRLGRTTILQPPMPAIAFLAFMVFTAAIPAPVATAGECVTATIVADFQEDGPFQGLWKYTFEVSWDTNVEQAKSHITFDLGLDQGGCPCICDPGVIQFDTPAGHSTGVLKSSGEPCELDYEGEFVCNGDPSIPGQDGPAVKWNPVEGDCVPGPSGEGTFCFYSVLGPANGGGTGEMWLKFGGGDCQGSAKGDLPHCNGCATPVEPSTWGSIKSLYGQP